MPYTCAFCYQLPPDRYACEGVAGCQSTQSYDRFATTCQAAPNVLCLGSVLGPTLCPALPASLTHGPYQLRGLLGTPLLRPAHLHHVCAVQLDVRQAVVHRLHAEVRRTLNGTVPWISAANPLLRPHIWGEKRKCSVLLGGFAADRFYLGYYGWAVFKLLSLGGLGVWAIVDAVLIGTGYLPPADGSLYFYETLY